MRPAASPGAPAACLLKARAIFCVYKYVCISMYIYIYTCISIYIYVPRRHPRQQLPDPPADGLHYYLYIYLYIYIYIYTYILICINQIFIHWSDIHLYIYVYILYDMYYILYDILLIDLHYLICLLIYVYYLICISQMPRKDNSDGNNSSD